MGGLEDGLVPLPRGLDELVGQLRECYLPLLLPRGIGRSFGAGAGALLGEGREDRFEDSIRGRKGVPEGAAAAMVEGYNRDLLARVRPALVALHRSVSILHNVASLLRALLGGGWGRPTLLGMGRTVDGSRVVAMLLRGSSALLCSIIPGFLNLQDLKKKDQNFNEHRN